MLARLHVVISSENPKDYETVKESLLQINPHFSISPYREYAGMKDHSEFFVTFDIQEEDVQALLDSLNNDWDGEMDDCICYGFNTKMFHPLVYYLGFTLYN